MTPNYEYDESYDQKYYTAHKVDLFRALWDVFGGDALDHDQKVNEILDKLDSDWDDDADGIDSYWLLDDRDRHAS